MKNHTVTIRIKSTMPSTPMLRLWLTDLFRTRVKELGRVSDVIIENIEEHVVKKPTKPCASDQVPCELCNGTGKELGEKCPRCNGIGRTGV